MTTDTLPPPFDELDQLRTFKDAAAALRIPYFKVQRAAGARIIPTYSLLNKRRYVKLRDILELMSPPTPQSEPPSRAFGTERDRLV